MNAPLAITIRFTCHKCGLLNQQVAVRPRREGEDLDRFLEDVVTPALGGQTHHALRPLCQANRLSELLIPTTDKGAGYADVPTLH